MRHNYPQVADLVCFPRKNSARPSPPGLATDNCGMTHNSPFSPSTNDRGAVTAEYAIATVAAAGFAGLLAVVLKSGSVQGLLSGLISNALSIVG